MDGGHMMEDTTRDTINQILGVFLMGRRYLDFHPDIKKELSRDQQLA